MKELYKDSNLNSYIKVRLTEEGKKVYQEYYADNIYGTPSLQIDDEGYVKFQIHDFMHIFGKRLFMGAELPCATNCKIQVKDEWHDLRKDSNDLPKDRHNVWITYINGYHETETTEASFRHKYWVINGHRTECDVIAWCEIPKFELDIKE